MIADAYADRKKQGVMEETWGHLAPEPGRRYQGTMLFTDSAYGDLVLIEARWEGLQDSPWLFEDMQDYIEVAETKPGRIYRWKGTYVRFKNGNHRFSGVLVEVAV
jgi:hypothetical protein